MTQEAKVLLSIGIATVVILVGGVFYLSKTNPEVTSEETVDKKLLVVGKNTRGPKDAKVTVVEYADFQCPACGAFHPEMKKILSANDGKVYFVFRHYPLPMHKNALHAAQAVEAAGKQKKFWEMHDMLFEKQNEWAEVADPSPLFLAFAKSLGLDVAAFAKAMEDEATFSLIQKDIQDGNKAGVSSTPTVFVNGKQIINSSSTFDLAKRVQSSIDAL